MLASLPVRLGLGAAAALVVASLVSFARAEQDEDEALELVVAKGRVAVATKGVWHINPEYPWKLVVGGTELDKTKFELGEKTAVVKGAPSGTGTLRGGVCAADRCRSFKKSVTVP